MVNGASGVVNGSPLGWSTYQVPNMILLFALLVVLIDPGGPGPPPIARLTEHGLEMLCRATNESRAFENIQTGQNDFVAETAGSQQVYYDIVAKDEMLASKSTANKGGLSLGWWKPPIGGGPPGSIKTRSSASSIMFGTRLRLVGDDCVSCIYRAE
jgi:hypothetical protein